ncbi:CpaF family protein [Raineyella sp. LH-20]|uniref:CpaF family protein n=1 Tax=Raineyella sp. LH-20 TaxID=3081204 RepID=UPI0029546FC8|nr:CpaF family protein [Raineyella sp. LH-20]WOP17750.1 CpaF family protein [Raineyella sp. LH-20]
MRLSDRLAAAHSRPTAPFGTTPSGSTASDSTASDSSLSDGAAPDTAAADDARAFLARETPAPAPRPPARGLGDHAPTSLPPRRAAGPDPLAQLKSAAADTLYERLGARLSDPAMDEETLRSLVRNELDSIVEASATPLTASERRRVIEEVQAQVLGLGVLEPLLDDDTITEIMVNGPDRIYVERAGRISRAEAHFQSERDLRRVIDRIVSRVGRHIDEATPLVDARLEDGSRVNAIVPPLAVSGPTLTIRKFSTDVLTVPDLIGLGTLAPETAELLEACVRARLNIIVSGGTGTGKTTMLNVLSSFIPDDERIITIEDTVELQLQQHHVVRLEARTANTEGRGAITIRDLVRNSLRMRPDRIVVGEVRDAEALDMLQAMNTGHDGSLSTVHSNSPRDSLARLETLVMMAGIELPLRAIREQISSAVDLIVHLSRLRDGTRRVVNVTEVLGMEGQTITLQDIFAFDYAAGVDRDGRFRGHVRPTGVRPRFMDRFDELGLSVSPAVFGGYPPR